MPRKWQISLGTARCTSFSSAINGINEVLWCDEEKWINRKEWPSSRERVGRLASKVCENLKTSFYQIESDLSVTEAEERR